MFKNYLVTAFRNIVRHKLYSSINIAGLAVAVGLSSAAVPLRAGPNHAMASIPHSEADRWHFDKHQQVATISTRYAPIVYYASASPQHMLVLAFGYPWVEASDATILAYAQANVRNWASFAERNHVLIIAPVLGGSNFVDYRELSGRLVDPDTFVNAVADGPARRLMPGWDGKFCLHGHSAGAQFAARYVVAHPHRLECAILSAPSTYAMPTHAVAWPFGMAAPRNRDQHRAPDEESWGSAATSTPIRVIVGSLDTETRPIAPGQVGASRLERAKAWVLGMHALAARDGKPSRVTFIEVPDTAHDERKMAVAAQRLLERFYRGSPALDGQVSH